MYSASLIFPSSRQILPEPLVEVSRYHNWPPLERRKFFGGEIPNIAQCLARKCFIRAIHKLF